jgi:hypothetical protein
MSRSFSRALGALLVWAAYAGLIALANLFAAWATGDGAALWRTASAVTLGVVAVPVFSVILPLWLAARWGLAISWWPEAQDWPLAALLTVGSVVVSSFDGLRAVFAAGNLSLAAFAVHFTSVALFQVSTFPLFAVLILGAWRPVTGLVPAMAVAASAVALTHLAQWVFFPATAGGGVLLLLFFAFLADLLLYLLTRSLWLAALAHCMTGAVALARTGTVFSNKDFIFWISAVLLTALFVWSLYEMRRPSRDSARVWLRFARDD